MGRCTPLEKRLAGEARNSHTTSRDKWRWPVACIALPVALVALLLCPHSMACLQIKEAKRGKFTKCGNIDIEWGVEDPEDSEGLYCTPEEFNRVCACVHYRGRLVRALKSLACDCLVLC